MAILISTPQDLHSIRNNLSGDYELVNDIDMSSWGNFIPIGSDPTRFTGNIDGKGFKIINLTIIHQGQYAAFIGASSGGTIKNLGLENVYVESNDHHVGGLMGLNYMSTISNCFVTGTIKQTNTSKLYTGGLVGRSYGVIENCFTHCNVSGGQQTGGFIGYFPNNTSIVKNNYSKSKVIGTTNTGAFYGGFNDKSRPTFENNFFDFEYAGTSNFATTGVTAKTTAQMKTKSTFINWDFENVWYMEDYPSLRVFSNIPKPKKETITVNSFANLIVRMSDKHIKVTKLTESILSPIFTVNNKQIKTQRVNVTYTLPIHTNVQKSNRTVRNSTAYVNTHINPIGSYVNRDSKTIKQLLSYMKPLQAHVDVLIPLNNNVVNAYLSVIKNPSRASFEKNMSEISYINNPSYLEVN